MDWLSTGLLVLVIFVAGLALIWPCLTHRPTPEEQRADDAARKRRRRRDR